MWRHRLGLVRRRMQLVLGSPGQRNVLYLYGEVIFAGILTAAASFDSAYVLRLGGSGAMVGLLSSLPALLGIFLYMPSARMLEGRTRVVPWMAGSLLLSRCAHLLIFALPFLLSRYLPESTVAVLIAATIPSVFFSTGWSPLLSDVVPRRSLAMVLSWRSILSSATVALFVYLAGVWLDRGKFPLNYQWMYAVGFLGGAIGVLLVSRIRILNTRNLPASASPERIPWKQALQTGARANQAFVRLNVAIFLSNLGMWMVGPLYIIFFVRELGATDGWIGLHGTLAHVGVVAGYWLWRRIIQRIGGNKAMSIARPLLATYAFMVALVPNLTFILLAGFLINVVGPGVNLSQSVIFLDLLPKGRRHTWMAIHSTMMNIGAFVCPLIGIAISNRLGICTTLLIGGTLRLLGALSFYVLRGKEKSPRVPRSGLRLRLFGGTRG